MGMGTTTRAAEGRVTMKKQVEMMDAREYLQALGDLLRREIDRKRRRGDYDIPTGEPVTEVAPGDWSPPEGA